MKELIEIQGKLKAPKNQLNKFGNYKYRSCEDILEAVKQLLEKQKCTLVINDQIEMIGTKYFVHATATIKNQEGETETASAYAELDDNHKGMSNEQKTGCCSSYARKYALNGLLAIDDNKDADTDEVKEADLNAIIKAFDNAKTKEEVKQIWSRLDVSTKSNDQVINACKNAGERCN